MIRDSSVTHWDAAAYLYSTKHSACERVRLIYCSGTFDFFHTQTTTATGRSINESVAGFFKAMIWCSRKEYVLKVFTSPIPKTVEKIFTKCQKNQKKNKNAKSNINPIYKMYQKKVRTELSSSTTHTPAKTQSKYNSLFSLSVTFDVPPTLHTNMAKWSPYILYAPPPGRNTHK